MKRIKKAVILIINVIILLLIASRISFKGEPGIDFVAATIGHAYGFHDWTYNPKENGVILTPPPNVNVFVKEEKGWMMGQQGDLIPIQIRIEVW